MRKNLPLTCNNAPDNFSQFVLAQLLKIKSNTCSCQLMEDRSIITSINYWLQDFFQVAYAMETRGMSIDINEWSTLLSFQLTLHRLFKSDLWLLFCFGLYLVG